MSKKQVKPGFTNYQREVWPIKFDFLKMKKDLELKKSRKFHFLPEIIQKVTDNSDSHSLLQQGNKVVVVTTSY